MISSDFRTEARKRLDGKWGTAVCIVLASFLISFAIGFIQGLFPEDSFISMIISIAVVLLSYLCNLVLFMHFSNYSMAKM